MIRIALFQPDIPQNTGAILRTAACLGLAVDLVEPAGFLLTDRALRRAGLDTATRAALTRHADWDRFIKWVRTESRRIILFTTRGGIAYHEAEYHPSDVLLFGRESSGVPGAVHAAADVSVRIPIAPGTRSLNVSVAAAIGAAEALRQLCALPSSGLAQADNDQPGGCPTGAAL